MTKTITPLADRVVVRIVKTPQSLSGIIVPETQGEHPERGIVVAVGKGRRNDAGVYIPLELTLNDEVFFSRYAAEMITLEGEELFIVREDQILAIVK